MSNFASVLGVLTAVVLFSGCAGEEAEETASPTATPTVAPEYQIVADGIDGGVLLGAWNNGDTMIAVGGAISGGGSGYMFELNGSNYCSRSDVSEEALWWIHGAQADDFYMVGEEGTIKHSVNGVITDESVDSELTLYGVWDTGSDVWVVGGNADTKDGEIWRKTAGEWTLYREHTEGSIFKVWCQSEQQCLFIGQDVALFLEEDVLTSRPTGEHLLTCRGTAWEDIWCVGGTSTSAVQHWNGSDWTAIDTTGLGRPLMGIWTDGESPVWVSGMNGFTAHQQEERWESTLPISAESFHAVWNYQDRMWFLGGNLLNSGSDYYGTVMQFGSESNWTDSGTCQ